jgi:hypothetical protein
MHITLGGAFSKRHRVDCGLIAIICKVPVLGRHIAPQRQEVNQQLPKEYIYITLFILKIRQNICLISLTKEKYKKQVQDASLKKNKAYPTEIKVPKYLAPSSTQFYPQA